MKSHVLSVGQCSADDARIARVLATEADAHLDRAHSIENALQMIPQHSYDLILVNRVIDRDGMPGIGLIGAAKKAGVTTPIILVSDYQEAQAAAVAEGALPGFGKSSLETAEVGQLLRQALQSAARTGGA